MFKFVLISSLIAAVYCSGELSIIHHPSSVVFKGHDSIKESTLPEVFAAALGFSTDHYSHWQGFYIADPLNMPEAVVTIEVDGIKDIGHTKGHHYPLLTNTDETTVFTSLRKRVSERYPIEQPNLVRIDLANGLSDLQQYSIFDGIKSEEPKQLTRTNLKLEVEEDREFLKDIALLNEISYKVENGAIKEDFVPDVYSIKISSLHSLVDLYGVNSTEALEGKQLLQDAINQLSKAFIKTYQGQVIVAVVTSDASHTRLRRAATGNTVRLDAENKLLYNLASAYTQDYPAIFNIILWFSVAMFFSLLAICYVTANMDPGRDSIIYRMTSTRIKKDN